MRCVCRMIFSHGFVHADLHAGNLRFFPPGRVVLLDLGLVGRLNDEDRAQASPRPSSPSPSGDGRTVARLFYENAPYRATPDYAAYEREVVAVVESLHRRGIGSMQITVEIGRIFDILRRHHIHARSHMTMVNLALMAAEGLGKRLAPELSLTDEALPYLAEATRRGGRRDRRSLSASRHVDRRDQRLAELSADEPRNRLPRPRRSGGRSGSPSAAI